MTTTTIRDDDPLFWFDLLDGDDIVKVTSVVGEYLARLCCVVRELDGTVSHLEVWPTTGRGRKLRSVTVTVVEPTGRRAERAA